LLKRPQNRAGTRLSSGQKLSWEFCEVTDAAPAPRAPPSRPFPALRFGHDGRFELQPAERRLLVDGQPATIGARALDLLVALAERPDHLLTKHELLDRVWPGLVVEEANLQVQISNLRKLLGNDAIATVPGRGYRFTAPLATAPPPPEAPAAAGTRSPTNLAAEQLPLYGRDDDIAHVRELLAMHRLVSIVGAGGIGKTRVGQAAAAALLADCPDGVWLVELAPLADPALLPSTVAHVLGVQLRAPDAPHDELVAALRGKRLLLLLDNCEHLLEATSLLAHALHVRTPQVRLLVTSQEPLRLPGEQQYRLGPLGVPSAAEAADPQAALDFGAVRLFVERVRALDPRFVLDAQQAGAVADICRQLDGLALAIELAAARVPLLGVSGVRDRLGERLRVLTAGSRIALRRHQTLRAALDWSHGLLGADERTVLRRLGVFSGGCTAEAAQQVAGDERLDEWAVLDYLAALVDKSLVVADGGDRPRYRLLESARAYALEKLAAAGETDLLSRRHAAYFAAHFKRAADALFADAINEDTYIATRAVEMDNLRAALAWALGEPGDTDVALALLAHTGFVSFILPSPEECEGWRHRLAQRAAGRDWPPETAALHAYVRVQWGWYHLRRGGVPAVPLPAPRDLRALDDPPRQAHAALNLAMYETWLGADPQVLQAAFDEVDRLEAHGLPAWLAAVRLYIETRVAYLEGREPGLRDRIERTLARLRATGDGEGRGAFTLLTHLAEDSMLRGRFDEAAERFGALAELGRRQRRDIYRMGFLLPQLAAALAETGRLDEARAVALEALTPLQHTAMHGDYAPELALVAARRGDVALAARLLGAGDHCLARAGNRRQLLQQRAYERTRTLLLATQPKARVEAWVAEGAALGDAVFASLPVDLG
jgi:predicted ATPase/DNA-binding winged helix-turn-helix (wHTH) protein